MLRVNLLPPYIYEGAKRRNVSVLWFVILLAIIGGFVAAKVMIDKQTEELVAERERLTPDADKADRLQAEANSINSESQAIRDKRDFVSNARKHNGTAYQPVVYNIRDYTMNGILYSSLEPSGNTVNLQAYAPTLAKVGHYLMWMEHNPEVSHVSISLTGLPTFPVPPGFNGQPQGSGLRPPNAGGYDFGVSLTLVKPIPAGPTFSGAAGGGEAGGGAGMMGGMGGPPGMPGMGGPPGMPGMGGGPGMPGGGVMSGGPPMMPGAMGPMGGGPSSGGPMSGGR